MLHRHAAYYQTVGWKELTTHVSPNLRHIEHFQQQYHLDFGAVCSSSLRALSILTGTGSHANYGW